MEINLPRTPKNLSQAQINMLDDLMANWDFRYGFEYIIKGCTQIIKAKEQQVEQSKKEKETLIEKYEGIINVKKLREPFAFKLYSYRALSDYSKLDRTVLDSIYEADLKLAEENEKIIDGNTKTIDAVVKTMEDSGIPKQITKYKTARSSTKVTVDATWYTELKNNYISNYHISKDTYKTLPLKKWYITLTEMVEKAKLEQLKNQKLKEDQDLLEAKAMKEKQVEAILIAHTCIKFNLDPLKITSRGELDKTLIELGHVPDSVINSLKLELNLA